MSNHLNDPSRSGTLSILTSPNTHSYLPPEIWGQIFRSLSPRDLISVADACPEWNELLAAEKKHALLELVLPLLNVSRRDILTCRKGSRGGKKMVDNILENFAEERQSFQFAPEENILRRRFIITMHGINNFYCFRSFEIGPPGGQAQRLLDRVGESLGRNCNPFLTRSIIISLNIEGEYTALEQMLTRFGHHVWSLTACVKRDDDNGGPYIANHRLIRTKNFVRLLNLVPNLKSLTFSSGGREPIEALSPEELPELKCLVSLSFEKWWNDNIETLPFAFLRRYGPQLVEWRDTYSFSLLKLNQLTVQVLNELLPNLKKLSVGRAFGSDLPKLRNVNWRLEELTLACFYGWTTKHVFDIISNFSQTLVQLQLKDDLHLLKPESCGGTDRPPCKTLPKLQVLRLDVNFDNVNRHGWFWNSVPMMLGHIKEIHFDREYISEREPGPRNIEFHAAKHIFLKLPNLERILFWQLTWNGRKLDIHVRSDYVWPFGELLLQRIGAQAIQFI